MFNSYSCSTEDTKSVFLDASESIVTKSTLTEMGNCALCENKLRDSEETEPLFLDRPTTIGNDTNNDYNHNYNSDNNNTININNFPNSLSYPLFYDQVEFTPNFSDSFAYQRALAKSCSLSTIAPSLKTNFSPGYLDCRLRYIRQTRRIQKYLRITPEGHLLVNDVKQYPKLGNLHSSITQAGERIGRMDCESFHPLSSLISATKLRRIHAAYWNLESRQDLVRSRSATVKETIASDSSTKHTSISGDSSPDGDDRTRSPKGVSDVDE
ncbi:hypothetical protein FGIG_10763 [Fasciola gigantica]|uniref:Uncharacterized protein n=1 Tax=Fasciola gigantica TaxID=46835 RepID=A0A504YZE1_FASGI|nr:hypothetical protein FGIG_10763 [Fasciola gigantica]